MQDRQYGKLQPVAKAILSPLVRFGWRVHAEGVANIPTSGGAILAPNHISVLDSFFVPLVLPRRITYVGKAEYLDDWKTRSLFPALGMIPIDRSGGDSSARALDAAASVLRAGELFGIYPEGTRSRSGELHKGHTGVARLALRTDVPIVPVGIVGTVEVQPPDATLPKPFMEVTIRFGEPIGVGRYRGRSGDRMILRQITDEVMYNIQALSGQEYVHSYATKTPDMMPAATTRIPVSEPDATTLPPAVGPVPERSEMPRRSSAAVLASRPMVDLTHLG